MPSTKAPELLVANTAAWRSWLSQNSSKSVAVRLVVARQAGTQPEMTYQDALDEALCHGWIDSGGGPRDERTRYVRFGPRKANSAWSRRNIGFIERLQREGRMAQSGYAAVERAKADGFWQVAYSADHVPDDLAAAFAGSERGAEVAWRDTPKKERYLALVRMAGFPFGSDMRTRKIEALVSKLEIQQAPTEQGDKESAVSTVNGMAVDGDISLNNGSANAARRSSRLATSRQGLVDPRAVR